MIIYHTSKKGFIDDVFNGRIADEIDQAFVTHLGRHTAPNEVRSWKNSMMHMSNVINTPDIPNDSGIAIEYQIPLTSKRVDFIISGYEGLAPCIIKASEYFLTVKLLSIMNG